MKNKKLMDVHNPRRKLYKLVKLMKLRIRIRCRVVKVLTEFQGFVGSSTLHLS